MIKIKESELHFSFVRSSGPGGQHVNKVSTAVQLKYNIFESDISDGMRTVSYTHLTLPTKA